MSNKKVFGKPRHSFNSIRELVKITNKSPQEILTGGLTPADLEFGLALIWSGLVSDNKDLTMEDVAKLIDDNPEEYLEAFNESGQAILPVFKKIFHIEDEADEVVDGNTKN